MIPPGMLRECKAWPTSRPRVSGIGPLGAIAGLAGLVVLVNAGGDEPGRTLADRLGWTALALAFIPPSLFLHLGDGVARLSLIASAPALGLGGAAVVLARWRRRMGRPGHARAISPEAIAAVLALAALLVIARWLVERLIDAWPGG